MRGVEKITTKGCDYVCVVCGEPIPAGTEAMYNRWARDIYHVDCEPPVHPAPYCDAWMVEGNDEKYNPMPPSLEPGTVYWSTQQEKVVVIVESGQRYDRNGFNWPFDKPGLVTYAYVREATPEEALPVNVANGLAMLRQSLENYKNMEREPAGRSILPLLAGQVRRDIAQARRLGCTDEQILAVAPTGWDQAVQGPDPHEIARRAVVEQWARRAKGG